MRTNLSEDEVHVDEGGDEDEWWQSPESQNVGIAPAEYEGPNDEEDEGCREPTQYWRYEPRQDDGDHSLVRRKAAWVPLGPHDRVFAFPN